MSNYKPSADLKKFITYVEDKLFDRDYFFIVCGKNGPTGKTHLTNIIRNKGYSAIELSEALENTGYDVKDDNENHYFTDHIDRTVVAVLNKPLEKISEKPPLGVMPRDMWDRKRQEELAEAMARYMEAGKKIPKEWLDEYNEISDRWEEKKK